MFTAALFTTAKTWKQPKYSWTDELRMNEDRNVVFKRWSITQP